MTEVRRFRTSGAEPMGLAFRAATLWLACREAHRIYAMEPATGTILDEIQTPGAPFGIAFFNDKLYVIIGRGDDDDERYLYRFTRDSGFEDDPVPCPDLSGAHLASDGRTLFLSQAHNRKILSLDRDGDVTDEILLDRRPLGMAIVGPAFYVITGDLDFRDLQLGRLSGPAGTRRTLAPLASIPFAARGLAVMAEEFWTADRRQNEVAVLRLPVSHGAL